MRHELELLIRYGNEERVITSYKLNSDLREACEEAVPYYGIPPIEDFSSMYAHEMIARLFFGTEDGKLDMGADSEFYEPMLLFLNEYDKQQNMRKALKKLFQYWFEK